MTDIDWREPPAVRPGRKPWMIPDDVLDALRRNPGKSARVAECKNKKFVDRLRPRHPEVELTARVAKCDQQSRKLYDVYAKWVG